MERPFKRIFRMPEVMQFSGLKETQLKRAISEGEFPAPIPLTDSGRTVGWLEEELLEWREKRMNKRVPPSAGEGKEAAA